MDKDLGNNTPKIATADSVPQEAPTVQSLVRYGGAVQGVGFRYRTRETAQAFPVTGYVKNLPNGQVELTVEGVPTAVQAFLETVERRMRRNIETKWIEDRPPTGGFVGFEIHR